MCHPCRAADKNRHYSANKQRYIAQAQARKRELRLERTIYLLHYFESHPCRDCGEADPVVLEFDHLGEKSFDVGLAIAYRNWESILDEIAKCEVVCANCHRRRISRRRASLRMVLIAARNEDG